MSNTQKPDHFNQPWMEWCDNCNGYVISLGGHCINDDSHKTYSLTPDERAQSGLTAQKGKKPEETETKVLEEKMEDLSLQD